MKFICFELYPGLFIFYSTLVKMDCSYDISFMNSGIQGGVFLVILLIYCVIADVRAKDDIQKDLDHFDSARDPRRKI